MMLSREVLHPVNLHYAGDSSSNISSVEYVQKLREKLRKIHILVRENLGIK